MLVMHLLWIVAVVKVSELCVEQSYGWGMILKLKNGDLEFECILANKLA